MYDGKCPFFKLFDKIFGGNSDSDDLKTKD